MASNEKKANNDDVAILDITTDENTDDQRPLLSDHNQENGTTSTTPTVNIIRVPSISRYRLTNILRFVLFIEFITVIIIWFAGNIFFQISPFLCNTNSLNRKFYTFSC